MKSLPIGVDGAKSPDARLRDAYQTKGKGPVIIYRPRKRGGGGGGLNNVKFSRSPFESYFTKVIPPNNI